VNIGLGEVYFAVQPPIASDTNAGAMQRNNAKITPEIMAALDKTGVLEVSSAFLFGAMVLVGAHMLFEIIVFFREKERYEEKVRMVKILIMEVNGGDSSELFWKALDELFPDYKETAQSI
jgi:hypothetical protein